jgi:hypothetical protein
MQIILSPIACPEDDTPPTVNGDVISYRGVDYDLTPLGEGDTIEIGSPFVGEVTRTDGQIRCKLEYKYNWSTSEDNQSVDWADYTFDVTSGVCPCPILRKQVQEVSTDE